MLLLLVVVLARYENIDTSTCIYFVRLQQQYGIDFQNKLTASEIHPELNNASQLLCCVVFDLCSPMPG